MDYDELKSEIKSISEIAAAVPEAFRERCFEILLQHLLGVRSPQTTLPKPPNDSPGTDPKNDLPQQKNALPMPSQVKVFLQKTGLTAEELAVVAIWEEGELHFIREPSTQKIARGQIEWSLLLALRNGVSSNSFSVDPEDVRSICQEKGFYDATNFSKNFKTASNAALFQNAMESQGEAQKLSSEGQKELAKLVKALVSGE